MQSFLWLKEELWLLTFLSLFWTFNLFFNIYKISKPFFVNLSSRKLSAVFFSFKKIATYEAVYVVIWCLSQFFDFWIVSDFILILLKNFERIMSIVLPYLKYFWCFPFFDVFFSFKIDSKQMLFKICFMRWVSKNRHWKACCVYFVLTETEESSQFFFHSCLTQSQSMIKLRLHHNSW